MVVLDASRRHHPVPPLAKWSLAVGIVATIGANLAHGLNHGPIGALVSAWPALALVGSFELLMLLIRTHHGRAKLYAVATIPRRRRTRPNRPLVPTVIVAGAHGANLARRGPQPASDSP